MSLRSITPCDFDGICPYNAACINDCEYWCGADEPEDYPPEEESKDCRDLEDLYDYTMLDLFDYFMSDQQDYHDRHIDPYKERSD